ncbi:MAG: hypothetical protein RR894_10450 [Terrisporobacter sp.]
MERCNNRGCNNKCNSNSNMYCQIKESKCRKIENCAEDISDMNEELLECVEKKIREIVCLQQESRQYVAKAKYLDERAEAKLKEVQMLVKKISDMVDKSNELYERAIDCYKKEGRTNRFCPDRPKCCKTFDLEDDCEDNRHDDCHGRNDNFWE